MGIHVGASTHRYIFLWTSQGFKPFSCDTPLAFLFRCCSCVFDVHAKRTRGHHGGLIRKALLHSICSPAALWQVDVLQACCGNAYRVSWFNSTELRDDLPPECFTTDDLWIAGYLSAHGDIKKVNAVHCILGTTHSFTISHQGDYPQALGPDVTRMEGK